MLTEADKRRRWWGTFFLVGAASLLIWGQTFLRGRLNDVDFVYYWLGCISMAALAFFTAVVDIWIIRCRARANRKKLEERLEKIIAHPEADPNWPKLEGE